MIYQSMFCALSVLELGGYDRTINLNITHVKLGLLEIKICGKS